MKHVFFSLIATLLLVSCKPNTEAKTSTEKAVPANPPSAQVQVADEQYPSITQDEITALYEQCDYIDFVFYELPFSMSYDNKTAIATALSWISTSVPVLTTNCKPLGRMLFQGQGEIILEAEIVLSESAECGHLIWIKDGQPVYANRYNANGKKYMQGIIQQNLNR